MKTKRKTWYLQKKDILYVEENHDGKYGAKGKERLPKRKLTPEDVQRVNAWNKSKRARLRLMEYFSPGDLPFGRIICCFTTTGIDGFYERTLWMAYINKSVLSDTIGCRS